MSSSNNWLSKFKNVLSKTSQKLSINIGNLFRNRKIDQQTLGELEEILLANDIGIECSTKIINALKRTQLETEPNVNLIQQKIIEVITQSLKTVEKELTLKDDSLNVIVVCGVNGNGKTTSIGKLAAIFKKDNKKVMLAACDTFRAAAVEQLNTWGERVNCPVISGSAGADPASVAYKALENAVQENYDILMIDTAGRLHNQKNLMDELAKIIRTIKKIDPAAPHHTLMVLDGTTGQNAHIQLENFKNIADISGLIVTKLDGTSKAGVLVGLADKFKLPVHFIGVGEQIEDLRKFEAENFARAIIEA